MLFCVNLMIIYLVVGSFWSFFSVTHCYKKKIFMKNNKSNVKKDIIICNRFLAYTITLRITQNMRKYYKHQTNRQDRVV